MHEKNIETIPEQTLPFSAYPFLQVQSKLPIVLVQKASAGQGEISFSHSSMSTRKTFDSRATLNSKSFFLIKFSNKKVAI